MSDERPALAVGETTSVTGDVQLLSFSQSSGRARQRTSSGASRSELARYSSRSRSVTLAQWMSSSTTTTGRRRASVSSRRRYCPRDLAAGCLPAAEGGLEGARDGASVRLAGERLGQSLGVPLGAERVDDNVSKWQGRDAVAVRQTPAAEHPGGLTQCRDELLREPGLACPSRALDRYECRDALLDCACVRVAKVGELALAADERHVEAPPDRVTARRDVAKVVGAHRLGFALQPEGTARVVMASPQRRRVASSSTTLPGFAFLAGGRRR